MLYEHKSEQKKDTFLDGITFLAKNPEGKASEEKVF